MTNSHTHTGYQCNTVSTNTAQSVAIPSAPHGGWSTSSEYTMVIDASRLSSLSVSDDKCGQSVTYKPSDIVKGLQELATKETIMKPKRVIFNNPATVVIWGDDSKTVVKCAPDAVFNEYAGFCAAVAKKIFGTNNGIRRAAGLPKEKHVKKEEGTVFGFTTVDVLSSGSKADDELEYMRQLNNLERKIESLIKEDTV